MERYEGYVVSPECVGKLTPLGIVDRINEAKKEGDLGCFDRFVSDDEVYACAAELKDGGFYKSIPKDHRTDYFNKMQELFKQRNGKWKIDRLERVEEEEVVTEDLLLLLGGLASQVLKPEEFGDYSKNGFDSFSSWVGSVGALVHRKAKEDITDRGYSWESKLSDGRRITNLIGANMHGDLLVEQRDLTSYPTIDPFGKPIPYRPATRKDLRFMSPHHSTEPYLLVATLDFIDQKGIKSEVLENKAKKVIEEIRSGGRTLGNFAEAYDDPKDNMLFYFAGYGLPFAQISEDGNVSREGGHGLATDSGGIYVACITPRGNLGFYYRHKEEDKKELRIEFPSSEIDQVIYGLVHQSRNGLGRTNPGTLANILEHRFSDRFKID